LYGALGSPFAQSFSDPIPISQKSTVTPGPFFPPPPPFTAQRTWSCILHLLSNRLRDGFALFMTVASHRPHSTALFSTGLRRNFVPRYCGSSIRRHPEITSPSCVILFQTGSSSSFEKSRFLLFLATFQTLCPLTSNLQCFRDLGWTR